MRQRMVVRFNITYERTMTKAELTTELMLWLILLAIVLLAAPEQCGVRAEYLSKADRLIVAKCLVAEADFVRQDHVAILHVLGRRARMAGTTLSEMARSYCSVFKRQSKRTDYIMVSTFAEPKHGTVKLWERTRRMIVRYENGELPDPCPAATHWGGRSDRHPKGWRVVKCGNTANIFYKVGE